MNLNENKYFKVLDIFIFNNNIACGIKVDETFWSYFINSKVSKLFLKYENKEYFLKYIGQEVAKGIRVLRVEFLGKINDIDKEKILENKDLYVGIYAQSQK